jgi:hypothetical protein
MGVAGVGVVKQTIAKPEIYLTGVILIRAKLCDVALNDVLCDNHRDFHVLVANKRQIVFGGIYLLANGISCPLPFGEFDKEICVGSSNVANALE